MSTFFSGTDLSTLQEEGKDRNHFVSLIVNNAGVYTAAITRKVKYTSLIKSVSYEGFDGVVNLNNTEESSCEEIEYFELNVCFEESVDNKAKELSDRLSEIKKSKTAIPAASTPTNNVWNSVSGFSNYSNQFPKKPNSESSFAKIQEPTLFENDSTYNKEKVSNEKTYYSKPIDKDIEEILIQLLTGSVTVTKVDAKTKQKLIDSVEKRFDARFGKTSEGLLDFEFWARDFVEFLLWDLEGKRNVTSVDDVQISTISAEVILLLEEMPRNRYIDKYMELLADYGCKY